MVQSRIEPGVTKSGDEKAMSSCAGTGVGVEGATVGVDKEHDRARGFVVSPGGVTVVSKGQVVAP